MPTYIYKADAPGDCVTCKDGIARWETLSAEPMVTCSMCGRMVHRCITRENAPTVGSMDPRLGADPLYLSQLARFPNDPKAYVSGPDSWRKRVDQAKRDGDSVREGSQAVAAGEDHRSPYEIKRAERRGE
jgi:hypothetical protein